MGFPPEIQPCTICGMEDDRDCNQEECAIMEHCLFSGNMYCQICVEQEHGVAFWTNAIGMYCDEHEDAHKERMRKRCIGFAQVQEDQEQEQDQEAERIRREEMLDRLAQPTEIDDEERVSERIRVELPEPKCANFSIYR